MWLLLALRPLQAVSIPSNLSANFIPKLKLFLGEPLVTSSISKSHAHFGLLLEPSLPID